MASFNYNLQQPYRKDKDGKTARDKEGKRIPSTDETRLYLFVIHDRYVCKLKTEFKIIPALWDFSKQRLKSQATGSISINSKLNDLTESVSSEYYKLRKDFPGMLFEEIAVNLKGFINTNDSPVYNEQNRPFFDVFDDYLEFKRDELQERTLQKIRTVEKSLKEFCPGITFDKVDLNFLDRYVRHLRNRAPKGRMKTRAEGLQDGLLNDTVSKYVSELKNFLKWGFERKLHSNNEYTKSKFSVSRQSKNEIVTLQMDELQQLYEHDFSGNERLEKVRDVFCFACFTGQRWSDIERFKKDQITGNNWHFKSFKTGKDIIVPLTGYAAPAMDILKKYDFELPKISAQKFNEYLKEAGRAAEMNRPVKIERSIGNRKILFDNPLSEFMSSHMGRRTAVSLLLNVEKMPLQQVRDITGHSTLMTLDKYINKDPAALMESMGKTVGIGKPTMKIVKTIAG